MRWNSHVFCLFLLGTTFCPASRCQPFACSLFRRRHGTKLPCAAAKRQASTRTIIAFLGNDKNRVHSITRFTSATKSSPASSTLWPRAKTIADTVCEISRQERIENEPAVCASLLGSAHPLAMTRIQWADQTGQDERVLANETVRPRTSLSLSAALCQSAMPSAYKQRVR